MILTKEDKRYPKHLRNGNILRTLRKKGGWAKGCIAGGICFLACGLFLALLFAAAGMAGGGMFFLVICAVPGLPLLLGGMICQRIKMNRYLKYYQDLTGFDLEEVKLVEQELEAPDMILYGNVPDEPGTGASKKHPMAACMITKHYFVMPMALDKSYIRRISDIILAAYSQRIPGIGGYKHGLVFLSRQDDSAYMNSLLTKDVCDEIISELQSRIPDLIPTEKFSYDGRVYDVILYGPEIIQLFKQI